MSRPVSIEERKLDLLASMLAFPERVLEWDALERSAGRPARERTFSRGHVSAARKQAAREQREDARSRRRRDTRPVLP